MKFRIKSKVTHVGCKSPHVGQIIALSHARDEYLVMWTQNGRRWQGRHSRLALKPA